MKGIIAFAAIVLMLFSGCFEEMEEKSEAEGGEKTEETVQIAENDSNRELSLITIYDNYEGIPGLRTDWGFSCLVKTQNGNILFDTGGNAEILLSNMEKLNIKPGEIDSIVLSHIHGDHTGGLFGVLEINSDLNVFVSASFPQEFKERIKSRGASVTEVSGPAKVSGNALSTGELGLSIKEQSLIVRTRKGLVVVTGCAHPGIVKIIEKAKEATGEKVFLVMGGFHLLGKSETEIKGIVQKFRELGVERIAPSHCSGDLAREMLRQEYGEKFIENGTGKVINI